MTGRYYRRLNADNSLGAAVQNDSVGGSIHVGTNPWWTAYFDNRVFYLLPEGVDGPLEVWYGVGGDSPSAFSMLELEADGDWDRGNQSGLTAGLGVAGNRLIACWLTAGDGGTFKYREWDAATHAWLTEVDTGTQLPYPHTFYDNTDQTTTRPMTIKLFEQDSKVWAGVLRHVVPVSSGDGEVRFFKVDLGAVSGDQYVAVNPVYESEQAQTVTPAQGLNIAVGVVTESETAQVVTPVGEITVPVGVVTESENAQPVGASVDGAFTGWGIPIGIP